MTTQTGKIFHVPYEGGTLSVHEQLFTDTGSGKKPYVLANDSVPLADIMRLADIGRAIRLEMPGTERYSGIEREAATAVDAYLQARKDVGAFARDYALIEARRRIIDGKPRPKGGDYVAVKFFHNATGTEKGSRFEVVDAEEETDLWLPKNNGTIIVPGRNGDYNRFGLPEETVRNAKEAIVIYKEAFSNAHGGRGITDQEASDMLSNWYILDDGWAAVGLWSGRDGGSRCVVLVRRPLGGGDGGRFAARRSPSGARPASEGHVSIETPRFKEIQEEAEKYNKIKAITNE